VKNKALQRAFSRVSFLLYSVPVEANAPHVAEPYMDSVLENNFDDVLVAVFQEPASRLAGWIALLHRALDREDIFVEQAVDVARRGISHRDTDVRWASVVLAIACETSEADDLLEAHYKSGMEDADFIMDEIETHLLYREHCL
jgi:hypothetical protein